MDCQQLLSLRDAYVDGELDLVHNLEAERHQEGCPACERAVRDRLALRDAVQALAPRYSAPADLRRRLGAAAARPRRWRRLTLFAPVAVAAGLAAVLLFSPPTRPSAEDRIAGEAVAGHVRSLMAHHLFDVESSDRHTVKPWFIGQVDFAPEVRDLADAGFPLLGGRLDYLDGRSVVALVYGRHRHRINLFIWPGASPDAPPRELTRQGYQLVHWAAGGLHYWAVSDLNATELYEFAERMHGS